MAKSPKSRCYKGMCYKVDAVKVKGLPEGGLFDIGVYTFSRPCRVAIYVLGTNPTLTEYGTIYLYLKTRTTKSRKRLS
jgi:hypothetical protein